MFFKFKIKIFEFISKISLINLKIENIKVYLILNILSIIFLMEIIYFNKNRIFWEFLMLKLLKFSENIEVYLILNTLLITFLIKTICFNKNRIF